MVAVMFREVPELHQHPADIVVAGVVCGRVVRTVTDGYRADLILHTASGEKRMSGYGLTRLAAYTNARHRLREEARSVLATLDATEEQAPEYGTTAAPANEQPRSAGEWLTDYCSLIARLNLEVESSRGYGNISETVMAPAGMVFVNNNSNTLSMSGPEETRLDIYRWLVMFLRDGLREAAGDEKSEGQ